MGATRQVHRRVHSKVRRAHSTERLQDFAFQLSSRQAAEEDWGSRHRVWTASAEMPRAWYCGAWYCEV